MSGKFFYPHLDLLERRFQALRDQIGTMPEASRPELEGALLELSQAIAALRADREAGRTQAAGPEGQQAPEGSPPVDPPAGTLPASPDQVPALGSGGCETILSNLFSAIPDRITIIDRDFNIIMSNWHDSDMVPEKGRRGRPKCYQVYHHRERPCEPCHVQEVFATGQAQKLEKTSDLDGRVMEFSVFPILDESGQVSMVVEHVRDVQERRLAEQALKESEDRFRTLIEDSPESLFLTDVQGTILAASRVAARRLGKKLAQILGVSAFDLFPPEVAAHRRPFFAQAVATGRPVRLEDPSGNRHFDIHFNPIQDADGKVSRLSILAIDITDRKNAEQALKDSEARSRAIFATAQDSIFIKDRSFRYTLTNPALERLFGRPAAGIIGKSDLSLVGAADTERIRKEDRRVLNGEVVKGIHTITVQDVPVTFHYIKAPLQDEAGEIAGICGIARDITDLKQAEAALAESEERFRMLFEHAPDAYILADMQGEIIDCNQAAEELAGYGREELIGNNFACLPWLDFRQQVRLADLLAQTARGEVMGPVDFTLTRKDGGEVIAEGLSLPLYIQGQNLVMTIIRDITARKQAEAALRESEARFKLLFEYAPDAYYLMDLQGNFLDFNRTSEEISGYGREELIGKNFQTTVLLDEQKALEMMENLRQATPGEILGPVEFYITCKDGRQVAMEGKGLALHRQGKGLLLGISRDITARKQAEAELRESERQKSIRNEILRIFLTAPDENMYPEVLQVVLRAMESRFGVFAYKDEHGALVAPSMTRDIWELCQVPDKTTRFPPETWGDNIWARAIRQKRSLWKNEPGLVPEGHVPIENVMVVPLLCRSEVFAHFEVANKPGGYAEADKVWLEDIAQFIAPVLHARLERNRKEAERQQAEAALKESEARFRHISSTISDISYSCSIRPDGSHAIDWLAGAVERITGYSVEEIMAQKCWKFLVLKADQPRFEEHIVGLAAGAASACELRLRHKNGEIVWVASFAKVVQEPEQPEIRHIYGGLVDITARKQAEAELWESEQRFRRMAETIQDVFWIAAPDIGKIMYVSPACEQVWGRTGQELYQSPQTFLESILPEDRDRALAEIVIAREQGSPSDHEYRIIRPDGAVRWIHDRGFPVKDDQGQVIMFTGVATDVTEHKAMEGQLLQAQKMEAVGRLAGGVAHDFNNLLMVIMGYGELMRAKIFRDDPLYGHLENILQAGDRAAALTQQLLTFSRQQIIQPQVIDLNRVVLDLEPMLRRLIGEDLHLEVVTDRRPAIVKADPGQMGQIVMNLVVNARDAMPQGGRLTLETAAIDLTEGCHTRFGLTPPGAYVRLEVQDTGVGMDEGTQNHVFEPFFTTKEPGKGTGLGLSTVYGIVKQSGGYLDLESSPGAGSTFSIYLPLLESIIVAPKAKIPLTASFQGEETILLVEDEDMLRGLLAKFLRLYGYKVLEARHGGEALLACERHPGPIHLMVTDVVMPQMSGRELADRLTPLHPEMKIIYMSGYTEDALVQHGVAELSVAFLQKPFRPIELARRVHTVLHLPATR